MALARAGSPDGADTSAEADLVRIGILRALSPEARLRMGLELTEMSRQLLAEGIRARHPEYDAQQLRFAMIRAWLGTELFRAAYSGAPELAP